MGFFSKLIGKEERSEADNAIEKIRKIIVDEQFQLDILGPSKSAVFSSYPGRDQIDDPEGEFGRSALNPIPVNGPIGSVAYLSKLESLDGQGLFFHRLGSNKKVDLYEAVTMDGKTWEILFLDMYHSRQSRLAPEGFSLRTSPCQFTGFNQFCDKFPYDYEYRKALEKSSGLSFAYASKKLEDIKKISFIRPEEHELFVHALHEALD